MFDIIIKILEAFGFVLVLRHPTVEGERLILMTEHEKLTIERQYDSVTI